MQCCISKPVIDRRLYSSSLLQISIRHIKYLKKVTMTLKPKDRNFFQYAKMRKSIKYSISFSMHEISEKTLALFNLALLVSSSFQKTVESLTITILPMFRLPSLGFKNVKTINLAIEGRRSTSSAYTNRAIKKILISPKLENIELEPSSWSNMRYIKRLRHIKSVVMNSKTQEFFKGPSMSFLEKLNVIDFTLNLDIENTKNLDKVSNIKSVLENCQSLCIKQGIINNYEVLLLPEMLPFLKNLKILRYNQDSILTDSKPIAFSKLDSLNNLNKLDLELNFTEISSAEQFFNNLSLPKNLSGLRMNLTKCKKDLFAKLSFKENFFTDLKALKNLKNLDFQIAKQLLSTLNSDYVYFFLLNLLSNVTKDLNHLKLTATGSGKADESLLMKILEFENLSYLSLDMFIKLTHKTLSIVKQHKLKIKNLSLYDNLLLLQLPLESLRNVEELCIYISPDSLLSSHMKNQANGFSDYEKGSYILKKVLNMKNVRNISLYLFKKELFTSHKEFIEGIKDILTELKYLESIFVLVWSIEISLEEAAMLEKCFKYNKMINFVYIMVGVTTIGRDARRCSYTSVM